jgi:glutamine synthetase
MGIPVEYSFHEDSPSQHEIDLRYTDALSMADNVMTFRLVVRETALEQGVYATFMPKPLAGMQGSGMHTHLSLFEGDSNVFYDSSGTHPLSKTGQAFVAGLLHHAAEITAVTNQLVNSYKRLIVGTEAPSHITWAQNHRAALVRVPMPKPGKESSVRIEYRSPDPACNPYLAYSLLLAAGMKGIDEGYSLPDEATSFLELSAKERSAAGVHDLPQSLAEALDAMEGSDLVREALGDHIFEWFLRNKRAEWADYKAQVTPFELDRYLPAW